MEDLKGNIHSFETFGTVDRPWYKICSIYAGMSPSMPVLP